MTNSNLSYQLMSLNYSNNITKTAQQWGWSERLSEWANFGGARIENKSDIFKLMMDNLRSIDNGVRATLLGKTIGNQAPYAGEIAIKKLLDLAQKSYDDKEYLLTISYLDQFYQKVLYSAQLLKNVKAITANLNKEYFKSLAEELTPEQKENIKKYLATTKSEQYLPEKERQEIEKSRKEIEGKLKTSSKKNKITKQAQFHKTAGLLDWIGELLNSRKSALSLWEKINPEASKNLKKDLRTALSASNRLLSALQTNLNTMSKARIDRKVADYLKPSQNIIDQVDSYSNTINNSDFSKYTSDLENVFNQIVPPEKQKQIVNSPSNTTSSNSRALAAQVSDPKNVSIPAPSAQQAAAVPSAAPAKVASAVQAVVKAEPAINNAQQALAAAPTPENPKAAGILQSAKNALGKLKDAIVGLVSNSEETPKAIVNENMGKINQSLQVARNSIPPETIAKVEEAVNAIENIEEDVNLDSLLPVVEKAKQALAVNPPTAPEAQPAAQEMSGFFARLINSIKNRGKAKVEQINQAVVEIKRGVEEASSALQAIDDLSRAGEEGLSPQVVQAAQEAAKELNNAVPPEVSGKNWFARAVNSIRDFIGIPANTSAEATIDGKKQNVRIQNVDKSTGQISVITSDGRQAILPPENISFDDLGIQINRMAGGVPDVASITDFDKYINLQYAFILSKLDKISSLDEVAKPMAELRAAIDEVKKIVNDNPSEAVNYNLDQYNRLYNNIAAKFLKILNVQQAKEIEQVGNQLPPTPNLENLESFDKFKVGDLLLIPSTALFDLSTDGGKSARSNPFLQIYLKGKGCEIQDVAIAQAIKEVDIPVRIKNFDSTNNEASVDIIDCDKIISKALNSNLSCPSVTISLDYLNQFAKPYTGSTDEVSSSEEPSKEFVPEAAEPAETQETLDQKIFKIIQSKLQAKEIINFKFSKNAFLDKLSIGQSPNLADIPLNKEKLNNIKNDILVANPDSLSVQLVHLAYWNNKYLFDMSYQDKKYGLLISRLDDISENAFSNIVQSLMPEIYAEANSSSFNSSVPKDSPTLTYEVPQFSTPKTLPGEEIEGEEEELSRLKQLLSKLYPEEKLINQIIQIINSSNVNSLSIEVNKDDFINNYKLNLPSPQDINDVKSLINKNFSDKVPLYVHHITMNNNNNYEIVFVCRHNSFEPYGGLQFFDKGKIVYGIQPSLTLNSKDLIKFIENNFPAIYQKAEKLVKSGYFFVKTLISLSNESPIIVASFIKKYANLMQNKNLSNQLIKIANQLI